MEQLTGVLVIAAMAALILLLSGIRRRRIQPYLDTFCQAYDDMAAQVFGGADACGTPLMEAAEGGGLRLRPAGEQPEGVRRILEAGVGEDTLACIRTMFDMRERAQAHLGSFNLIGGRINGVLNRVYDLTNLSASVIRDPRVRMSDDEAKDFTFFLNRQGYIRETTLAAIRAR